MEQFYTNLEVKADKEEDRTVEFVASKEVVDRDGEIVKVSGIKYSNYKRNPVILWAHDRGGLPIGKAIAIRKSGQELRMKVQFAKPEEYGFADTVYKLVKGGYLGAVSLGFLPNYKKIEYPKNSRAYRIFNEIDLLELSIVPVPANQEALTVGKALEDGVIDEVEKEEWDIFVKEAKFEEKTPFSPEDDASEPTEGEDSDKIDELVLRVKELESEIAELKAEKSYLKDLFNKDTSAEPKEGQTDEDLTEEDMTEIMEYFGVNPEDYEGEE